MIALDLPPPLWVPAAPAIVRPAEHALLKPGAFHPVTRAERRAIIADLVRTKRLTAAEAKLAMLFLMPVVGWGLGVVTPVSITQTDLLGSTAGVTTYTFTDAAIGAADSTRQVVVCVMQVTDVLRTISSATIGGVAATIDVQQNASAQDSAGLIRAAVPTGTTATIAITFSGQTTRCYCVVYSMLNAATGTPDTDSHGGGSGVKTIALDIPANGLGLAAAGANHSSGISGFTWGGLTEDVDRATINTGNQQSTAFGAFATAQTGLSVTATPNVSTNVALCGAGYGPL